MASNQLMTKRKKYSNVHYARHSVILKTQLKYFYTISTQLWNYEWLGSLLLFLSFKKFLKLILIGHWNGKSKTLGFKYTYSEAKILFSNQKVEKTKKNLNLKKTYCDSHKFYKKYMKIPHSY